MDACFVYEVSFVFHRLCCAVHSWGSSSTTGLSLVGRVLNDDRIGSCYSVSCYSFLYRQNLVYKSDASKKQQYYHLMVISTHKKPFPSKNSLLWSQTWVTMAWEHRFSLPSCYHVKDVEIWAHADNTQAHIVLQKSRYWKVSKIIQLFVLFCF